MTRRLALILLSILASLSAGCSDDGSPAAPQGPTGPQEIRLAHIVHDWSPTVEQEGVYNGTFSPTFVFNDIGAHTQMFDFVEFTRVNVGQTWEVTSQEDHQSYDHLVRQLTDGRSTSAILNTCWMERSMCLPVQTSDDFVLYPYDGIELDVDLQGWTITRFVFVLERVEFTPYSGLFDGTSVRVRWRVDIYGYDGQIESTT